MYKDHILVYHYLKCGKVSGCQTIVKRFWFDLLKKKYFVERNAGHYIIDLWRFSGAMVYRF